MQHRVLARLRVRKKGSEHTMVISSQISKRKASCARASREDDGLPRPKQSTFGEMSPNGFVDSRRHSERHRKEYI